jgi:hypothetical protein
LIASYREALPRQRTGTRNVSKARAIEREALQRGPTRGRVKPEFAARADSNSPA